MIKKALLGQISDLDIRLLRIFRVVAECGGMSAAELELNIGRSTISRHIKDLEIRLGLTLCHRGRAGFALTEEGQRIYDDSLRLLASIEEFRSGVDDIHKRMTGSLKIGLFDKTATNSDAHISEALGRFNELAPEVCVELYVEPLNTIERSVMDGRFHVGILPSHRDSSSLIYHPLFDEKMYLYCSPKHPIFAARDVTLDWQCMRAYQYAGLGYHSPNMEMSHSSKLERSATAYDQEAIATLILSGRYIGFLPEHYAQFFVQEGKMRQINNARFQYDVHFHGVLRRAPKPSRTIQMFIQCLLDAHEKSL